MNTIGGTDFNYRKRVEDVKTRQGSGGEAVDAHAVLGRDTVEPTAAAGATCRGTILGFRSPFAKQASRLVEQFGGHWAVTDAGVVGLEDAEHGLDLCRADAHADGRAGGQRRRDRGRDVFVSSGIEVQQRALSAFEEDRVTAPQRLMDE